MEDRMKLHEAIEYLNCYANNPSNGCGSYMHSAINTVLAEIRRIRNPEFEKTAFAKLRSENVLGAAVMLSNAENDLDDHSIESWIQWLEKSVKEN